VNANFGSKMMGWNGTSDSPSLTVRAANFEQAKMDIEYALGKHIEQLLRKRKSSSEHAVIRPYRLSVGHFLRIVHLARSVV
jgi:hypothetical protein